MHIILDIKPFNLALLGLNLSVIKRAKYIVKVPSNKTILLLLKSRPYDLRPYTRFDRPCAVIGPGVGRSWQELI